MQMVLKVAQDHSCVLEILCYTRYRDYNICIHVENAVVIGTRKHFEVTNMYKLFLS